MNYLALAAWLFASVFRDGLLGPNQDVTLMTPTLSPNVVTSRTQLRDVRMWTADVVRTIRRSDGAAIEMTPVHTISYRSPDRHFVLSTLTDERTGRTYVVRGQQTLYIFTGEGILVCLIGGGYLHLTADVFQAATTDRGAAMNLFVEGVTDAELLRRDVPDAGWDVNISEGVIFDFWTARSSLSSQTVLPTVLSATFIGKALVLRLQSDGGVYEGEFSIDIDKREVIASTVRRRTG